MEINLPKIPFLRNKSKKQEQIDFEESVGEFNESLLTSLSPMHLKVEEDKIRLGSNVTRTLVVMDYETIIDARKVRQLDQLSDNVSIINYILPFPRSVAQTQINESVKQSRMKMESTKASQNTLEQNRAKVDSGTNLLRNLAHSSTKLFFFHTLIHIVANNEEELDKTTNKIRSLFSPVGTAQKPALRALDAFKSSLPLHQLCVDDLSSKPMDTEAVSNFFPFHENEMFSETGLIKGRNKNTGNVVIVDDDQLLNRHEFVIGISGSGKSTYIFQDMMNKWSMGRRVIVNDPKGEFGKIFKDLGGEWVKFQMDGGNIINPFDLPNQNESLTEEGEANSNVLFERINNLLVMFKLMYPKMEDTQENILSSLLERLYASKNITKNTDLRALQKEDYPTLSDLDNELNTLQEESPEKYSHLQEFHLAIDIYVHGIYSKIFNGYTDVNVDNDLISYDSASFQNNEKLQRIIYYNILSHTTYDIMQKQGKVVTQFYIDEAHVIADPEVPLAMRYVFFMMKVLRSFNCGVTPATQSISDFLSAKDNHRNYGQAVINQSVQRLYLPMSKEEVTFLENELSNEFSEDERTALIMRDGDKGEQAGKGIFFKGTSKVQLQVMLTKDQQELWFDKKKYVDLQRNA